MHMKLKWIVTSYEYLTRARSLVLLMSMAALNAIPNKYMTATQKLSYFIGHFLTNLEYLQRKGDQSNNWTS